jgi:phosphocarrier protein
MSVDGKMTENGPLPPLLAPIGPTSPDKTVVRILEICNKKGLHARASAKFVQTVEQFEADVWVTRGNERVGGTSIMGLMMLAAGTGTSITIEATGPEAGAVVDALAALVSSRFSEDE